MRQPASFNCDTCSHKNCDENNPAHIYRWSVKGLIESKTCLLPMVTNNSWMILDWYEHYKGRVLLKSGGLLEQPKYYIEVMTILKRRDNEDARNDNNQS